MKLIIILSIICICILIIILLTYKNIRIEKFQNIVTDSNKQRIEDNYNGIFSDSIEIAKQFNNEILYLFNGEDSQIELGILDLENNNGPDTFKNKSNIFDLKFLFELNNISKEKCLFDSRNIRIQTILNNDNANLKIIFYHNHTEDDISTEYKSLEFNEVNLQLEKTYELKFKLKNMYLEITFGQYGYSRTKYRKYMDLSGISNNNVETTPTNTEVPEKGICTYFFPTEQQSNKLIFGKKSFTRSDENNIPEAYDGYIGGIEIQYERFSNISITETDEDRMTRTQKCYGSNDLPSEDTHPEIFEYKEDTVTSENINCNFTAKGETIFNCTQICQGNTENNNCSKEECEEKCKSCTNDNCKWTALRNQIISESVPEKVNIRGIVGNNLVKLSWIKPLINLNDTDDRYDLFDIQQYYIVMLNPENDNVNNVMDIYSYDSKNEFIDYFIEGLENNKTYNFFVLSRNNFGISDKSNIISLIPNAYGTLSNNQIQIQDNQFNNALQAMGSNANSNVANANRFENIDNVKKIEHTLVVNKIKDILVKQMTGQNNNSNNYQINIK